MRHTYPQPTPRRRFDREVRADQRTSIDTKSEEAFRLVATIYQALLSAESSERSLRDVTSPELAEFFRSVQQQQLGIAQQARSMLVDLNDAFPMSPDGHTSRIAG